MMAKKMCTRHQAARLFALLNDETQPAEARFRLLEWFDQLLSTAHVTFEHPAFFSRAFVMACERVQSTKRPRRITVNTVQSYSAHQAYEQVQAYLQSYAQRGSIKPAFDAENGGAR